MSLKTKFFKNLENSKNFQSKKIVLFLALVLLFSAAVNALECGETITEDIILTEDLLNCQGSGIVVGADDLVIDCDNYLISGPGDTDDDGTLADEGGYAGIYIGSYDDITVKNCKITNFTYGLSLGLPADGSQNDAITSNKIFSNYIGIMLRYGDNQYNLIQGNTIYGIDNGIHHYGGSGIYVQSGTENPIESNTIFDLRNYGIFLGSDYNSVYGNSIENTGGAGFFLYSADFNDLSYNTVSNTVRGFYVRSSSNNQINFNNIWENSAYGLWFYSQDAIPTLSNTAFGNYIQYNNIGVYMSQHNAGGEEGETAFNHIESSEVSYNDKGFYLKGHTTAGNVHDNKINHNNIRSNTEQAYDYAGNNLWNNELGGNYWDDYDTPEEGCEDLNGDYVCDEPRDVPVDTFDTMACDDELLPGEPDNGCMN